MDAGAGVPGVEDEAFVAQIGQAHLRRIGQGMVSVDYQAQRVAADFAQNHPGRVFPGQMADEAHVEPILGQGGDLVSGKHFVQGQGDAGGLLPVVPQQAREHAGERHRVGEADAQLAHLAPGGAAGLLGGVAGVGENLPGVGEKALAGFGKGYPTAVALEQGYPKLAFQGLDLLGQRRLADVQALGGPGEVELFGDGDEVAQMAQFH